MVLYLRAVKEILSNFIDFEISQVPSALNAWTNALEHPSISKPPKTIMQTEVPVRPIGYLFGVPLSFVIDNNTQFDRGGFRSFCEECNICLKFSSVAHPNCNGLAEAANKCILNALKKKVDEDVGNGVEELPSILWPYHTTHKNFTGETPFKLTYRAGAVTLVEVSIPKIQLQLFDEDLNSEGIRVGLDLLDEV
ncbi:uncharacterized protein LOC109826574 [Asparagus officinalis]|uniref:uncharacterized protein LOC109826574 n=1 Tax=Asparagus officinalis TaxID=4686 RepID=UPI00098E04FE|nr:uncharacterized protein LOC109826574 [Asparagus officinalis]